MPPEWMERLIDLANDGVNKLTEEHAEEILKQFSESGQASNELQERYNRCHAILTDILEDVVAGRTRLHHKLVTEIEDLLTPAVD